MIAEAALTVLLIGDSLTLGHGPYVEAAMPEAHVVNIANPFNSSPEWVAHDWSQEIIPSVAVLLTGSGDASRPCFPFLGQPQTPVPEYRANLLSILNAIEAERTILIPPLEWRDPDYACAGVPIPPRIALYQQVATELCAAHDWIECGPVLDDLGYADFVHLDEASYQRLGEAVAKMIRVPEPRASAAWKAAILGLAWVALMRPR